MNFGERTVQVKALEDICRIGPTYTRDGVLGLLRRTASQIELSHTNYFSKQGLILDADF